jgi:hypothetical protein
VLLVHRRRHPIGDGEQRGLIGDVHVDLAADGDGLEGSLPMTAPISVRLISITRDLQRRRLREGPGGGERAAHALGVPRPSSERTRPGWAIPPAPMRRASSPRSTTRPPGAAYGSAGAPPRQPLAWSCPAVTGRVIAPNTLWPPPVAFEPAPCMIVPDQSKNQGTCRSRDWRQLRWA